MHYCRVKWWGASIQRVTFGFVKGQVTTVFSLLLSKNNWIEIFVKLVVESADSLPNDFIYVWNFEYGMVRQGYNSWVF